MDTGISVHSAQRGNFAGHPTGFRKLTLGLLHADHMAEGFTGLPDGVKTAARVLAAFKAAAPFLGYGPRLVHVIDWLFKFTQPQDWEEGSRPIVWPSARLQQDELGLGATQGKALNRQLIENGLITMKDSPNGKRYGIRNAEGRIVEAYGFDLTPLAARYAEFTRVAEEGRAERQRLQKLRRRATIARNGITQLLETAREYGFGGEEWPTLARDAEALSRSLRNVIRSNEMEAGVTSLERWQHEAREHLQALLKTVHSGPKGPENRPHILPTNQNPNPNKDTVIAPEAGKSLLALPSELTRKAQEQPKQKEPEKVLRLRPNELLRLAPRLRNYLQAAAPGWRDIIDAADGLRYDLDVSKPLWGEACLAMGREQAAIALAIVSTKNPEYFKTTAGGYFHGMVAKAKRGELNLDRTIWALRGAAGAVRSPADFSEHRRYQ